MADFWIKVEKGTPDKPEVLQMAADLNIEDPDTITGKLVRVWSWFDSNSENGHAPSVTNVLLDRLTGVKGFCDSMILVGWLEKTDDGVLIPNYDRHLGQSAKKRGLDAERKRKSRDKSRKEPDKLTTEIGLEERESREDIDIPQQPAKTAACQYQKIADLFNKNRGQLPECQRMNDKRKRAAKKFYGTMGSDLTKVDEYFSFVCATLSTKPFYYGDNNTNWKADIEYVMRDDVVTKAVEGNL